MKRFKRLGILLAVLVVVCLGTLLLSQYEQKQEQIKNSSEIILEIPRDSVTALSWEYNKGGSLTFHRDGDGWLYDEDSAFPVSGKKMEDILSHFESFGVSFVIENVEDYSQYGLDEPECTLHITTQEEAYAIRLGDFSQMDQQRYVDIGDGKVYLVPEDPMDYADSALSSVIEHDDTPGFETVVDVRFTGDENYIIQRMEDTDYSYSSKDVYFTQENGKYLPLDKAAVTKYLNTITTLDLQDYVTYNATQEELEQFGLAEPELSVTVNYTHADESSDSAEQLAETCVIHIGRNQEELAAAEEAKAKGETAQSVSAYVRVGDSQIVYALDQVDYGILSKASYDDLRHKEVFWGDFDDVTQIHITLEGKEHTLVSEEDKNGDRSWHYRTEEQEEAQPTEENPETQETEQTRETEASQPTEETEESLDISDLSDALKALSATSFTSQAPEGKEEIRLTLHLDNQAFPTVEMVFYRCDGTSCLAVVDGESVSLVPRGSVVELMEAVQAIVLNGCPIRK